MQLDPQKSGQHTLRSHLFEKMVVLPGQAVEEMSVYVAGQGTVAVVLHVVLTEAETHQPP